MSHRPYFPAHCVDRLRQHCLEKSSRPFIARGAKVIRCSHCLLAQNYCICHARQPLNIDIEFILLFHRDEIHKPTNSGRLIADLFPQQTHAFLWSRTAPDDQLLSLIQDKDKPCRILFPKKRPLQTNDNVIEQTNSPHTDTGQLITKQPYRYLILDGTWKQASKMFYQSRWLASVDSVAIESQQQQSFLIRHAKHAQQFATAEVTALLLDSLGQHTQADALQHYYQLFNRNSLTSRGRPAEQLQRLLGD